MPPDGRNFKLYRYTDNVGGTWSLRVEQSVGDDALYGFGAYNGADPLFIRTARNFPRTVTLMDPDTHRTVTRPVGSVTADAWDTTPFTDTVFFPGKADAVTYQRVRKTEERLANRDQIINNLPEPDADAP